MSYCFIRHTYFTNIHTICNITSMYMYKNSICVPNNIWYRCIDWNLSKILWAQYMDCFVYQMSNQRSANCTNTLRYKIMSEYLYFFQKQPQNLSLHYQSFCKTFKTMYSIWKSRWTVLKWRLITYMQWHLTNNVWGRPVIHILDWINSNVYHEDVS